MENASDLAVEVEAPRMKTVSPGELVVGEVLLPQDLAVMRLPPMRARRIPCMCDVRSRDILTYEWNEKRIHI